VPEQIPDHLNFVGRGWHPLLLRLHEQLLAVSPGYSLRQVKEKYGTLRIYLNSGLMRGPYLSSGLFPDEQQAAQNAKEDAAARRLVAAAEEESGSICESCGNPGLAREGSWIKTLCDGCYGPGPRAGREGQRP
jgi:hypothetical protein